MSSDAIAFTGFAMVLDLVCAATALLVRTGQRRLAGMIAACLAVAAFIILLIAYTSNDDYVVHFALLTGAFAIAGLLGCGLGVLWQWKRG